MVLNKLQIVIKLKMKNGLSNGHNFLNITPILAKSAPIESSRTALSIRTGFIKIGAILRKLWSKLFCKINRKFWVHKKSKSAPVSNAKGLLDYLHEKINSKPSRAEIIGWLIGFGAIFGGFLGMFN